MARKTNSVPLFPRTLYLSQNNNRAHEKRSLRRRLRYRSTSCAIENKTSRWREKWEAPQFHLDKVYIPRKRWHSRKVIFTRIRKSSKGVYFYFIFLVSLHISTDSFNFPTSFSQRFCLQSFNGAYYGVYLITTYSHAVAMIRTFSPKKKKKIAAQRQWKLWKKCRATRNAYTHKDIR